MIGLGIDAGASSSRWLLLDEARGELGRGRLGPITGHIFTEDGRRENLERLDALLDAVLEVAKPDAVVGGITGLHKGTDAEATFVTRIAKRVGLEPDRIHFDNDMSIAYLSAFAPGAGVLVYAGTGSVGYHIQADGSAARAGGYGYLIDDAGAGYWIGHRALKQVFRWLDERGAPADTPLAKAIYTDLGSDDWDDIIQVIYGGGRSRVAALAPRVADAAYGDDDAAKEILGQAGAELARLAQALFTRLGGPMPVAFAGGVSKLSPFLTRALEASLPAHTPLEVVSGEPVLAAARMALEK